jgi:hypothetical protein
MLEHLPDLLKALLALLVMLGCVGVVFWAVNPQPPKKP